MEAGGIHLNFTDIKQKSLTQNCGKYDKNRKSKRSEALILEEKQKKKNPHQKKKIHVAFILVIKLQMWTLNMLTAN